VYFITLKYVIHNIVIFYTINFFINMNKHFSSILIAQFIWCNIGPIYSQCLDNENILGICQTNIAPMNCAVRVHAQMLSKYSGSDAFFGKTLSDSPPEQSRRMSTGFETNSKWKAMCVDLYQKCRLCCLKGKQP